MERYLPKPIRPAGKTDKDQFLQYDCIHYNGKKFTVLQVIKFYAFVRGGIHLRAAEKDEYNELKDAFEMIKINGELSLLDHTMSGIVEVVYDALAENKERLLY